jgi:hypothetical protein
MECREGFRPVKFNRPLQKMSVFNLDDIMELKKSGHTNRQRTYQHVLDYIPHEVVWHRTGAPGRGNKCDLRVTEHGYKHVAALFNHRGKGPAGFIYGFCNLFLHSIVKVGKTYDYKKRIRGYHGVNRMGKVLFVERVVNRHVAERNVLAFMRNCTLFAPRKDMGSEYFQILDERATTLLAAFVKQSQCGVGQS